MTASGTDAMTATGTDAMTASRTVVAVILAAGRGERFGAATPKQLLPLAGKPMVCWSVDAFAAVDAVDAILVVTAADQVDTVAETLDRRTVIAGGRERHDSVRNALAHLAGTGRDDDTVVLIHDAARPLIDTATIDATIAAIVAGAEAVGVGVPASDTIFEVEGHTIVAIPDRARLWQAQTPQGFRLGTLRAAHEAATADPDFSPTDDCGVVARYLPDTPITVVRGTRENLKVTHPHDLAVAAALLHQRPRP